MTKGQITAAWHGKVPPNDLNINEQPAYIMLRAVYREYRAGVISLQEGEKIKGYLTHYERLGQAERVSLLQYVFVFLCERAGTGDPQSLADSKILAAAYHHLTGRQIMRPTCRNTVIQPNSHQ